MPRRAIRRVARRRRRIWLRRIRFIVILLVLFFIGFHLKDLYGGLRSIEAVSKAVLPQANNSEKLDHLKVDIANYIASYHGQYGVYYYDLTTGEELGENDEEEYTAASTLKVPLNLYLYNRIKAGAVNPDGTLTYLKEDYEDGTGQIRYDKVGTRYTIRELSRLSIVDSDNVAANMLIRYLGLQNLKDYMKQVGGSVVVTGDNISSPKDMGLYMKLVYQFYKTQGALGNELMNNFLDANFDDRIPEELPVSVKVAHKIGNEVGVVDDVGVVFTDKPYVIAVMSKGVNETEASAVIAHISKMVYDAVGVDS